MSGYRNGAPSDLDNLYDQDIVGDGPQAVGFNVSPGVPLKYAAAKYGQPGPACGYRFANNQDIGPEWCAKGTAVYHLSINGSSYASAVFVPIGGSATSSVTFLMTSATAWQISSNYVGGSGSPAPGVQASGSVPNGAVSISLGLTYQGAAGDTGAGTISNNAASRTACANGVSCIVAMTGTPNTQKQTHYSVLITFYNSAGASISSTTVTFVASTSGLGGS